MSVMLTLVGVAILVSTNLALSSASVKKDINWEAIRKPVMVWTMDILSIIRTFVVYAS